jgi:WD40-like Beta Propeller Repeat
MRTQSTARIIAPLALLLALVAVRPIAAQEPRSAISPSPPASNSSDENAKAALKSAVSELALQLKLHPPETSKAADRVAGLYMAEVATGEVTLIADQPEPDATFCGSAAWSNDGKRILFDAMRPQEVARARIKVIELVAGRLTTTDLGVGNCASFSTADDQIIFLLNSGGLPGVQGGIWSMKPDGSGRRRLGSFGRPELSPDGRKLLLDSFRIPATVTLTDVGSEERQPVRLRNLQIHSVPHWAGDGTIVAAVGAGFGDSIALIDVTDPAQAKVKQILWKMSFKGQGPDVQPVAVVYRPGTGRCVFVAKPTIPTTNELALYWFERGRADQPKRVEREGADSLLQDLALSPDGRYVLFTSNRTGPRQRGSAGRAQAPGPKAGADK